MNSPALDIATIIANSGLGIALGTSIFVSHLPDSPDSVMAVSSITSLAPETITSGTGFGRIDKPNVQVLIRTSLGNNASGYTLAESVKNLLHGMLPFEMNGTNYHCIFAVSDIGELGTDAKIRPVFSINFRIERSAT